MVEQLAKLARTAESETVRLRSLRAILVDMMAVSRYAGLEFRMTGIETELELRREGEQARRTMVEGFLAWKGLMANRVTWR